MSDSSISVPIPQPDRDTAPYWQALADGRLLLQRCSDCRSWTWPARPICSRCFSDDLRWEGAAGTGEVYSWIVTYQPYSAALAQIVPYAVALVRIDEQADIMIPGRFVPALDDDAEIHQGMKVRMATEKASEDIGILDWVPA